jgi:uncharacterized protein YaaR (DUF327 family)
MKVRTWFKSILVISFIGSFTLAGDVFARDRLIKLIDHLENPGDELQIAQKLNYSNLLLQKNILNHFSIPPLLDLRPEWDVWSVGFELSKGVNNIYQISSDIRLDYHLRAKSASELALEPHFLEQQPVELNHFNFFTLMDHYLLTTQMNWSAVGHQLDRFDLEFSLAHDIGVGIFSYERADALELIWQSQAKPLLAKNDHNESAEQEIPVQSFLSEVIHSYQALFQGNNVDNKIKNKVFATFKRDAEKLDRMTKILVSHADGCDWQISRIFKSYSFDVNGDFSVAGLGAELGLDKRIRFRFTIPNDLDVTDSKDNVFKRRVVKKFHKICRKLNAVASFDHVSNTHQLDRARFATDFELSLDAQVINLSSSREFLLELVRNKKYSAPTSNVLSHSSKLSSFRKMVNQIERNLVESFFPLTQIRFKTEMTNDVEFSPLGFAKTRNIELHYRRQN